MATAFVIGTLIDGTGRDPVHQVVLVVEHGRISALQPRSRVTLDPRVDQIVDLSESVVLPGLIDAHCHLFSIQGRPKKPMRALEPEELLAYVHGGFASARWWLDQGVTTVRDLGTPLNLDLGLRDLAAAGTVAAPRIFGSGKPIVAYGRSAVSDPDREIEVSSADQARRAAREQLRAGADLIKLFASAGMGGAIGARTGPSGWEQLTVEEMAAATAEAHKAGRPVTAHAISLPSIKHALQAGVDAIEHANYIDEETIALMRERGAAMIPTLAVNESLALHGSPAFGGQMQVYARTAMEAGADRVRMAREAGIPVAAGTDPTRKDTIARECRWLHTMGLTPMEVIEAATRVGAEVLRVQDRLGTLEVGKLADLVAFEGNPLDDLQALERVRWVVKEGVIMRAPEGT